MTTAPERLPMMTQFILGDKSFESTGVSELLITRDGKKMLLPVPIRSINVPEAERIYSGLKPPERMDADALDDVKKETKRAFGKFYDAINWATIIAGLNVVFKDDAGQVITDPELIRNALESAGLTQYHVVQLVSDITALTRKAEEQADFLSGNALDLPKASSQKSNSGTKTARRQK